MITFPGGSSDKEYAVFLGAWGSCKLKRRRLSRGSSLLCTTGDGKTDGNCKIISAGRGSSSTVNSPKAPATSSSLCTYWNLCDMCYHHHYYCSYFNSQIWGMIGNEKPCISNHKILFKDNIIVSSKARATFLFICRSHTWHYFRLDMKLWQHTLIMKHSSLPWYLNLDSSMTILGTFD